MLTWRKEEYIAEGGIELWNIWLLLNRVENAKKHGFLNNLFPTPGKKFNLKEVDDFMQHMEYEWEKEWKSRHAENIYYPGGAFKFTQLPLNAKCWLYEAIQKQKETLQETTSTGIVDPYSDYDEGILP